MGNRAGIIKSMNTLRIELKNLTNEQNDSYDGCWRGDLYAEESWINEGWSIDWVDLVKSAIEPGEYFILTCSCGFPDCARLYEPIRVTHDNGVITWQILKPDPKRKFEFSQCEYRQTILSFFHKVELSVPRPKGMEEFTFGHRTFWATDLDWCVKTLETGVIDTTLEEDSE